MVIRHYHTASKRCYFARARADAYAHARIIYRCFQQADYTSFQARAAWQPSARSGVFSSKPAYASPQSKHASSQDFRWQPRGAYGAGGALGFGFMRGFATVELFQHERHGLAHISLTSRHAAFSNNSMQLRRREE